MPEKPIRQRFTAICEEAVQADKDAGYLNCRVLEPYFRKLIELADQCGHTGEIKDCFCDIIRDEIEAPQETLSYCMRALRYGDVLEESKIRLGSPPDPRWMNIHSDIVHAIEDDDWKDSEMWLLQS